MYRCGDNVQHTIDIKSGKAEPLLFDESGFGFKSQKSINNDSCTVTYWLESKNIGKHSIERWYNSMAIEKHVAYINGGFYGSVALMIYSAHTDKWTKIENKNRAELVGWIKE